MKLELNFAVIHCTVKFTACFMFSKPEVPVDSTRVNEYSQIAASLFTLLLFRICGKDCIRCAEVRESKSIIKLQNFYSQPFSFQANNFSLDFSGCL